MAAVERALSVSLLIAVLLVILGQIIARSVFGVSVFWANEFARYAYVWLCCASAVLVAARREHIAVELGFLERSLGPRARRFRDALSKVMVLATSIFLVVGGSGWLIEQWPLKSAAIGLSLFWLYGAVYLAFLGVGAHALADIIALLKRGHSDRSLRP